MANNLIFGNRALNGGGVRFCYFLTPGHEPVVANNVIADNDAENGGGVHVFEAYPTLLHNTVADNRAVNGGGLFATAASSPAVLDCILWGDEAPTGLEIYIEGSSSLEVDYSDVQGGEASVYLEPGAMLLWGAANFDADPLFAAPSDRDYHIRPASSCVDRGVDGGIDDDMDGDPRPFGTAVDVGADEVTFFTLDLDAAYVPGELRLSFLLGLPEPATWATAVILTYPSIRIVPLWTVPLPVIDPPLGLSVPLAFPSIGWIGVYTGLFTGDGLEIERLVWVDTGM